MDLVYNKFIKCKEKKMVNVQKNLYKDYEELLIKNDKLSEENRKLKYTESGVRIDIWTHFMRGCIIDYVH